jgi:LPXTG-motif cell wall-anchored protein
MFVNSGRRVAATVGLALAVTSGTGIALASSAQAAATSMVSVVHGIPGQPVDVYVNGRKLLDGFQPATVAGPLKLAAGTYDVALTKPGGAVGSPLLEDKSVQVPGGRNLSLVAHLDGSGKPALTAFVNDTSALKAGMTRLIVRHTAQAPAVDIRAGGKPVFKDLTNPHEAMADLPAGTVKADVVLAGSSTVVLGPKSLDLAAGKDTIVYAIGSADKKTLTLVAQTIDGLGGNPSGMPAGTGGQNATGVTTGWYALTVSGILLVAAGALMLTRRRAARV